MRSRKLMTATLSVAVGIASLTAIAASVPAAADTEAAADFTGYQIVKLPNANVPNFQRRVVRCPAGKKAVGGGAEAQGNQAVLVGSFPTDDGGGWIGLGRQPGYNDVGISVYVICANVG
ncbi:hypothetical protein [Streptosporangium sp. CA-115845]|uniref:hypothetical protein n=1 Tax=Streptosporangium sp. CA-115845 TaxID=3240071 RepID=UPI003D93D505